jgi:PIN domain nuclease of toxin-antitoxin system
MNRKFLIDTHVCLWAVAETDKLSTHVKEILQDPENEILFSQISLLEIAIKFQTGKLPQFNVTLEAFNHILQEKGFTLLHLTNEHLFAYFNSNFFSEEHKDPFDRCLAVIADIERARFITKDDKFQLYKDRIPIVW